MLEDTNRRDFLKILGTGTAVGELASSTSLGLVRQDCDIKASIRRFVVDGGTYQAGDTVTAQVTVRNTGECAHEYFIGFGVIDQNGTIYDNNATTGHPLTLAAGQTKTTTVEWQVEEDAPPGAYSAGTAVWKESSPNALETRLDQAIKDNVFQISGSAEISPAQYRELREALEVLREPWEDTALTASRQMVTDLRNELAGLLIPDLSTFLPEPQSAIADLIELTAGAFEILASQRRNFDRELVRAKWKIASRRQLKPYYDRMSYDYGSWSDLQARPYYPLFSVLIDDLRAIERRPTADNVETLQRDAGQVESVLVLFVLPHFNINYRTEDDRGLVRTLKMLDVVAKTIRNMPEAS